MRRRAKIIIICLAALGTLAVACSQPARYRVLNFFFDGVPQPGAPPAEAVGPYGSRAERKAQTDARRAKVQKPVSVHAPYAIERCDSCHDTFSGQLNRTVEAGLCASCHPTMPAPAPFLHGPVAARACMQCHQPHSSPFAKLLTAEDPALCLQCHQRSDLSSPPHDTIEITSACLLCHDPHGGNDRYFLKPTDLDDGTEPG